MISRSRFSAAFLLLLATSTWAFDNPCTATSSTPCLCPQGTQYAESATTAFIGAPASVLGGLINNFYNLTWTGPSVNSSSQADLDNIPGVSERTVALHTTQGAYNLTERLLSRETLRDGSFSQSYEQTAPIEYSSGNGSFSGYWTTMRGDRYFQNETMVTIIIYACMTGHPIDFAATHGEVLTYVISLFGGSLGSGASAGPISIQSF
ncbi:hypothetical protein F5Y03DRAFT_297012 [Xylaria venustula]|nr:hypothetical protein F5Y03DRAFT_297012 [Xylaria venustula]